MKYYVIIKTKEVTWKLRNVDDIELYHNSIFIYNKLFPEAIQTFNCTDVIEIKVESQGE